MKIANVILLKGHIKGCSAVNAVERGHWDSPWFLDTYNGLRHKSGNARANLRGRPSNSYRWVSLRCNSQECNAKMLLNVGTIEDVAEDFLLLQAWDSEGRNEPHGV